jgi:outer membrane immunogenic protein
VKGFFMERSMKQKGYLLATASGFAVAAAGGAQAADLPMKVPMPAPVPAASWAGWYVGLSAGVNWQNASNASTSYDFGPAANTNATGFIGGGQIGYNWQDGNFVYGLEGDISGLTGKGSTGSGTYGKSYQNQIRWLSTFRARAGLAVGDTLAYMTGGLAVGGVKNSISLTECCFSTTSKSASSTRVGWTVGGGVEHMIPNSHWTVALEALFVDLGTSTVTGNLNGGGPDYVTKRTKFSNQAVIGRLKLNYKF